MKNKIFHCYKKSPGFALVELAIAILIIGILASVASLSIIKSQKVGRDAQRKSDIAEIEKTLASYYAQNKMYPVTVSDVATNYCYYDPTNPGAPAGRSGSQCSQPPVSSSWKLDTTATGVGPVWINGFGGTDKGLIGYTDKLPNDPKGNNGSLPANEPINKSQASNHYYGYYSKPCWEQKNPIAGCPYLPRDNELKAGSFYILTAILENTSDSDTVGNSNPYYLNCQKMNEDQSYQYNQNLYIKIKAL